jgi:uncharacterized repeat protein (TIGR02543 family)
MFLKGVFNMKQVSKNSCFRGMAILWFAITIPGLVVSGCSQSAGVGGGGDNPGPAQYTLTFDSHGGSEVAAITANEGTIVPEFAAPTKTGYVFTGWYNTETGNTKYSWPHTLNASITMHAQWQDEVSFNITLWVNEDDGNILASDADVTLSRTGSVNPNSFTATVNGAYSGVQWYLKGSPVPGNLGAGQSITIEAVNYEAGGYRLGVTVTKDGVPYSTEIRFTVTE